MNEYESRVADLAERENAVKLYEAMVKANDALWEAQRAHRTTAETPEQVEAVSALWKQYDTKRHDLTAWYDAELAKINGPNPCVDLEKAAEAAAAAYNDAPGYALDSYGDEVERCALSNAPLYEGDEVLEIGDKKILACVLLSDDQITTLTAEEEEEDADSDLEDAA